MKHGKIEKVIGYSLAGGLMVSLYGGGREIYFINPREIEAGGKNCEYSHLCAECEIVYTYGAGGSLNNVQITYNPYQHDARTR